jgi:predicted urease superfamily metal-dependent hydrolase
LNVPFNPVDIVEFGFKKSVKELPTQIHHFATNKNKTFTHQMESIAKEFELSLNGSWNKQALPHLGRHPNEYHEFVLDGMKNAKAEAGGSQAEFLKLFNQYVKQRLFKIRNY